MLVLRRVLVLRLAAVRGFAAVVPEDFDAPDARFAVERAAGDLRAVDARLAPAPVDFALLPDADDRDAAPVERFAVDRFAVERFAVDLRAPLERPELLRDADELAPPPLLEPLLADPSIDHLPDITRCAASATASAMIAPSFVALDAIALAACDAVSAASSPASRIFLRAAGLALIAAAAAASPAASISLLIAALASLSIVALLEPERDEDELERELELEELEPEERLRVGFAIIHLPASRERHFTAVPVP